MSFEQDVFQALQKFQASKAAPPVSLNLHKAVNSRVVKKESTKKPYVPNKVTATANLYASEFVATEAPLSFDALGDLNNDILDLFGPNNFPGVKDYEAIAPSLRLASLLLQHSSLWSTLRTVLGHGPMILLNEKDRDNKKLYQYPEDTSQFGQEHVKFLHEAWQELAKFVTFKPKTGQKTACAWTKQDKGGLPDSQGFQGHTSTIYYSPRILQTLTKATKNLHKTRDVPLLLSMRFSFAVQLAHEACHALVFANDGHRPQFSTEPFFPGDKTAEIGFKMEDVLFGGHVSFLWGEDRPESVHAVKCHRKTPDDDGVDDVSNLVGLPVVYPWPSPSVVKSYQHENCGLWIMKDDLKALERDSKEIIWRISLTELSKFFQMSFWVGWNPQTRLERKVGFVFNSDKNGRKVPFDMATKTLKCQVPEGYELTEEKAIVKK